ncbi:MAG: P-loop NTPase [Candidatus Odinarchaeota archaeon]
MKIVIFLSAQGGVGRSQIISSLAYLLSNLGRKVGVIDLCGNSIEELLKTINSITPVLVAGINNYKPQSLIEKWEKEGVDFTLVNHLSDYSEIKTESILIVTTPLRLSLLRNRRLAYNIRNKNPQAKISVVLNKVGECENYEYKNIIVEKILGAPVIQQIPYDLDFIRCEQLGTPLPKLAGKTPTVISLLELLSLVCEIQIPVNILKSEKHSRLKLNKRCER